MRVLEAFGEPISYGGQESFVMNMLACMDRRSITADLLTPYYCDNPVTELRVQEWGGIVYSLGCSFKPGKIRAEAKTPIRRFLKTHHYDVIHIHSSSNSMLAMYSRLAAEAGIPRIIAHSHCTGRHGWKHFVSKLLTAPSLLRYPTDYCSCSQAAGEWRFPRSVCRSRLLVINNGIDTERFRYDESVRDAMRRQLGISEDTVLIACVGRLDYQKNQSFLLDVLAVIREKLKDSSKKYVILFAGDGEDREALKAKSCNLGLKDAVIFTGAVDNVENYLQAADVAAMPSRYEGLAIAVIEEQASGLEIVASKGVPAVADVTGGVIFLPEEDAEMWAEELMKEHRRHPEQADLVAAHGYSTLETAKIVSRIYMS